MTVRALFRSLPRGPFLSFGVAVLALFLAIGSSAAQRPDICGPGAKMTLKCSDACIICDIDGFTGRNDNGGQIDEGDLPKDFCTTVNHNIQWIGFMAGSRELTIDLTVTNCTKGDGFDLGLEAGVYEVADCDYKRAVSRSNCNTGINNNTTRPLVMDDLVPGKFYYLVIDGNNRDVCDYKVTVTKGTTEIPQVRNSGGLRGPTRMCNGPRAYEYKIDAVAAATYYDWTLDGEPVGTERDLSQKLTFPKDGEFELCVTASSICNAAPPECLKIKIGDFPTTRIRRTGCEGSPVVVEGATITASGTYPYTFKNSVGCDSTIIYDVVIGASSAVTIDTTLCRGTTTKINGRDISASGVYTFENRTKAGCDSTVTYRVTLVEVARSTQDLALCSGQTATLNGRVISAAGTYTFDLKTRAGCDSIATYRVTVADVARSKQDLVLCAGQTATLNGRVISAAGTYDFVSKSRGGCDSIATYRVTVTDTVRSSQDLALCAGQTATVNGRVISAAGTYDFALKTRGGCDSIATYRVAVTGTVRSSQDLALCMGQAATVNGRVIAAAGTYDFALKTRGGCDSIATYRVTVTDTVRSSQDLALCAGQPATLNGQIIAAAGTYDFALKTRGGCDSIATYRVTVTDTVRSTQELSLCAGQTATLNGQIIAAAGTYDFALITRGGCDSIATYRVTVTDTVRSSQDLALCAGQTAQLNGQIVSAAGTYDFALSTRGGCDSIATYRVTVGAAVVTVLDTTICYGDVIRFDGRDLREEGVYRATRMASTGCDSIVELTLKHRSCGFNATAEANPVTCAGGNDGSVVAYVVGPAAPYTISYAHNGRPYSTPVPIAGDSTPTLLPALRSGTYVLRFTDRFGANVEIIVSVTAPPALSALTRRLADGAYDLRCAGGADGQVLALASGGVPPYRFRWSDGSTDAQRVGLPAGTITVVVTDGIGCLDTARVTLSEPPRLVLEVQAIDQGCDPVLEPGAVSILSRFGGRGGYQIQIDGGATGPLGDRYVLDPGRHVVTLSDVVDCKTDTALVIDALTVPAVSIDTVWRILKGEEATLSANTLGKIVSYTWSGPTELSCAYCPTPRVSPLEDATYELTVTNADGCEARTEALVLVLVDRNVFAPTAITPNGDGVNDGFTVYVADEGSVIEEMRVFDRWGEEMFLTRDIPPGNTSVGWSGTFRGQEMNPAVFVYWARVRNSDGATELVKGEFTLMR